MTHYVYNVGSKVHAVTEGTVVGVSTAVGACDEELVNEVPLASDGFDSILGSEITKKIKCHSSVK